MKNKQSFLEIDYYFDVCRTTNGLINGDLSDRGFTAQKAVLRQVFDFHRRYSCKSTYFPPESNLTISCFYFYIHLVLHSTLKNKDKFHKLSQHLTRQTDSTFFPIHKTASNIKLHCIKE